MKRPQYDRARKLENQLKVLEKQVEALNSKGRKVAAEHQLAVVNCDHKLPSGKSAVKVIKCSHGCKHKVCTICANAVGRQPQELHTPGATGIVGMLQSLLGPGATIVPIPLPLGKTEKNQVKSSVSAKPTNPANN